MQNFFFINIKGIKKGKKKFMVNQKMLDFFLLRNLFILYCILYPLLTSHFLSNKVIMNRDEIKG